MGEVDVRREGTVRSWKDEDGHGFIAADDGEVLWVHFSGILGGGYRRLREGDRVAFVWRGSVGDHGRHAAEDVVVQGDEPVASAEPPELIAESSLEVWIEARE